MQEFTYNNKTRMIPEDLEELSPEQYYRYLELVIMMNTDNISPFEMKCKLISLLLNMKCNFVMCRESIVNEINAQLGKMNCFFYIKEEGDKVIYDPHIKTGRNLLPSYKGWIGPEDMFNDITYGQFVQCLNLVRAMEVTRRDKDNEQADYLMSEFGRILYKNEDPKAGEIPPLVCFHSYIFFCAVWELICTVPIPINGEEINFSILFQEQGEKRIDDKTGWIGISFEIASSGVFGNVKQINETPFWDILLYLYKCRFESLHNKK